MLAERPFVTWTFDRHCDTMDWSPAPAASLSAVSAAPAVDGLAVGDADLMTNRAIDRFARPAGFLEKVAKGVDSGLHALRQKFCGIGRHQRLEIGSGEVVIALTERVPARVGSDHTGEKASLTAADSAMDQQRRAAG